MPWVPPQFRPVGYVIKKADDWDVIVGDLLYLKGVLDGTERQDVTIDGNFQASKITPPVFSTAYPYAADVTIRANSNNVYIFGPNAAFGAANAWFDGTNWSRFSSIVGSALIVLKSSTTEILETYKAPSGAGNIAWTLAFRINRTAPSAFVMPSAGGNVNTDWPASWGGGIATYDICAQGIFYSTLLQRSDPRRKADIRPIKSTTEKLKNIAAISFVWKDSGAPGIGLDIRTMETSCPELLERDEGGKAIGYNAGGLLAYLVKALQELEARIATLEAKAD